MGQEKSDSFDTFDPTFWNLSDFAVAATWNQTAWEVDHAQYGGGDLTLRLDGTDTGTKPFTGAEIQSRDSFGYGSFEVRMRASGESGTVSAFFLYTGEFFGADAHNEIDFEFLGNNPSQVSINYYYGDDKLANYIEEDINLGFDASAAFHDYRIDWMPDAIRWFVDDRLFYEIRSDQAPLPIPNEDMRVMSSLWTGDTNLEHWHGPVDPEIDTSMQLTSFSYREADIDLPVDQTGAVTFAGTSKALVIDMAAETYAEAATVLPIGDSLTVGYVDAGDPNEAPEERDGYRFDLFQNIVAAGGWIDYVGFLQSGPSDMLDRDYSAIGGMPLRNIVRNDSIAGEADLSDNLDQFLPDIVLFMAGTNDYNRFENGFFNNNFPSIMNNIGKAIDQFLAMPGSEDSYLVISTLAPKIKANTPEIYADYLNEGYSTVNGSPVVGDAGNGTYQPGIKATVLARAASTPNILLFENPVTASGLSPDDVHFSHASYAAYAAALADFLEAEIGLAAGTFDGDAHYMQSTQRVVGSDAGDRILGTVGDDEIDGGGGGDYIDAGSGADTIIFGAGALDGTRDVIAGFSITEGDTINLSRMAAALGWSAQQVLTGLVFEDGENGVQLSLDTGGGLVTFAEILGQTAAAVEPSISAAPLPSADDDGNLALTAPDLLIDETELGAVDLVVSGLDADASGAIIITDGVNTRTQQVASDGVYSFDLTGFADGAVITSITATTATGETITLPGDTLSVFGPPPNTGDDDGNLVLTAPDVEIDANEVSAVAFATAGLDADATAVVTVSDGANEVVSGLVSTDGTVTLDLSTLSDGPLTSSVTATDTAGARASVSGPGLTLATAPDTSADEDGNLALSAPDLSIDATEVGTVLFTLSGLDSDATAVITVGDGVGTVQSAAIGADGTVSIDLSTLQDGPLTSSVTATDASANTASVAGPGLTLDTSAPPPSSGAEVIGTAAADRLSGIAGEDTTILGLAGSDIIQGRDGDDIVIGGADPDTLRGGDGGDTFVFLAEDLLNPGDDLKDFDLLEGDRLELRDILTGYDGLGILGHIRIAAQGTMGRLEVDVDGGGDNFTMLAYIRNGRALDAETLWTNGDILITSSGPPPNTGDDDGNLVLTAPDVEIDANEVSAVAFAIAGLDADATAVVTVSDGANEVVSGPVSTDGTVTLDLSTLSDGPLTSSVTATDTAGARASVSGPGLTLATAPDTSADEDGNLALSAPDLSIDATEVGTVLFTLSGLDSDATAVITVGDGVGTVQSAAIGADGTVSIDLSTLQDGPLTSSVTATDASANTASVAGPGLTLDTSAPPPSSGAEVIGTAAADRLNGIAGEDTTILGLAGSDIIQGRDGDDIVIGGADPDTLRGGDGGDTFVFLAEDMLNPGDDLKDFDLLEGDRLELRDILTGYDGLGILGHIRIAAQGTMGRLEVDVDGGGDNFTMLAYIRNGRALDAETLWANGDILITA
ncbi:family 16 glycosylhydrolase [Limimaricola litoreus]|uniref:Beta-glucanase n=1 Tax=Limimaricola litoreus TaxID=2955316 RepID=A0A9X2FVM0_9RHOB|nr:family 16 glycosylhydrolase [Limimaricola litoreus]MCP1169281.1 family 16 glycosylhydrolase [Limimaricola litoreus]